MNISKEKAKEFLDILEQLPEQQLISHSLTNGNLYCTIGAILKHKNHDVEVMRYSPGLHVAKTLGIDVDDLHTIILTNDSASALYDYHGRWQEMIKFFKELSSC